MRAVRCAPFANWWSERLVCLDCNEGATLDAMTTAMTDLAEFALTLHSRNLPKLWIWIATVHH
jgi:hypothetical protein